MEISSVNSKRDLYKNVIKIDLIMLCVRTILLKADHFLESGKI